MSEVEGSRRGRPRMRGGGMRWRDWCDMREGKIDKSGEGCLVEGSTVDVMAGP